MSEKRGQCGRFKSGGEVRVNGTQVKLIKADLNITAVGGGKQNDERREKNIQNKTGNSKQKP